MRTLLARRGFRNLLVGQTVSALGDWMATIALMLLVLELTGSSAAVGGMLVLRLLPAAVAGPLATRLVRRWNRRRTMLAADLFRAAAALLVPLVREAWWVYLWAFAIEAASLVFLPARDASVPDLAGEEDLPLANGLLLASSYGMIPVGAAAFGGAAALQAALPGELGALAGRSYLLVFAADALTFLVSFALLRPLRELDGTGAAVPGAAALPGTVPAGRAGAVEPLTIPLVRRVLPAAAAVALGLGTLFSVGVAFVRRVLGASDAGFGVLIAVFGVGAVGGLAASRTSLLPRAAVGPRPAGAGVVPRAPGFAAVRLAAIVQGATVAAMSLVPGLGPAFLGAAAFGACTSVVLAGGMSLLQLRLAGDERVAAFAAFHVGVRVALSAAALGAGLAVDLVRAVRLPLLGRLEPERLVLLAAGLVAAAGGAAARDPGPPTTGGRR
ncbi:MAG TPA: MFS transporter [Actinomycetota bacterium]|nr:MFS transporter [Actinomycetota bacterium]